MFTDETERRDWIFGALVTVFVIGVLVWLNGLPPTKRLTFDPPIDRIFGNEFMGVQSWRCSSSTRKIR
jgi:hypothetical protein